MSLKQVLSRMKLIEIDDPAGAPAAPSGKLAPNPVLDILATVPEPPRIDEQALARARQARTREAAPAAGPAGPAAAAPPAAPREEAGGGGGLEIPDFEDIYRAAGIAEPSHGFSAYKVLEILSSPDLEGLDGRAKAAALTGFLKMNPAGPVPLADIIQDAVRRDQALDKFSELLRSKMGGRAEEMERENARLQAEIDELARRNRDLMEANRRALEAEQERLAEWMARKRIEERKLFDAVGPFVEANPVSMDGAAPAAPAAGPADGTGS
jgi:hypothetical protein